MLLTFLTNRINSVAWLAAELFEYLFIFVCGALSMCKFSVVLIMSTILKCTVLHFKSFAKYSEFCTVKESINSLSFVNT